MRLVNLEGENTLCKNKNSENYFSHVLYCDKTLQAFKNMREMVKA
jgi:hypothetical protein